MASALAIAGGLLALPPADDAPPPCCHQHPPFLPRRSRSPTSPSAEREPSSPGSVVQVTNADAAAHTLTATSGAFDTGVVDQGATASFTAPVDPGTYEFTCEIHPSMTGSLVIG